MTLDELRMEDVESYNRLLVEAGYLASQVKKRLQAVKAVIDRAGRPELERHSCSGIGTRVMWQMSSRGTQASIQVLCS